MIVLLYYQYYSKVKQQRDVAQFGSAPSLGLGGQGFESPHPEKHAKIKQKPYKSAATKKMSVSWLKARQKYAYISP